MQSIVHCMAPFFKSEGDAMFFTAFRTQMHYALRQRITQLVFWTLFLLVGLNFVENVTTFCGMDVTNMYHPMKMLTLSYNKAYYNSEYTLLIVQMYPLLVACPGGLLYAKEKQLGLNTLLEARIGSVNYRFSKLLAVFCTTTVIFMTPFLIEILLNYIVFPAEAIGDFSKLNTYDSEYLKWLKNYGYSMLYSFSPVLYAITSTIIFGVLSGIMGMVVSAFSMIIPVKYRVIYILLSFILLNSTIYFLPTFFSFESEIRWYSYYLLFNEQSKNMIGFLNIQILLVCFALISAYISGRKDCISE